MMVAENVLTSCFLYLMLFQILPQTASQVNFTTRYAGKNIKAIRGSSVNFTWTFSGSFRFIKWGFVSPVDQGQIPPANVLVTVDGRDGSAVLSVPSSYSGRVSGIWDRQTSPGQVIFTLSSIKIADDRVFGCHIRPVNLADSIVIDTVHLVVIEGAMSFTKEPDNPSYVTKGNNVTVVWDYAVTDRQAELKAITWEVYISNMFKLLIVKLKNGDRVVKSDIPPAYTGRVDIE
ncbi:uncharacterized protein LOC144662841 [Oculina patagonica]